MISLIIITITISLISIIIVAIYIPRSDKFSEIEKVTIVGGYIVSVVLLLLFFAAGLNIRGMPEV